MKYLTLSILLLPLVALAGTINLAVSVDTDAVVKVSDITTIQDKLPTLTAQEKTTLSNVLQNKPVQVDEIQNMVNILNAEMKGRSFTQDEKKYLIGMTGSNKATDRVKYLSQRVLVDKLVITEVTK